ncbi:hypothetical protein D3C77_404000 [compost metagenome]
MIKKFSAIILSTVLLMMLFLQLGKGQHLALAKQEEPLELAKEQWSQLWEIGKKIRSESVLITIKWQGAWQSKLTSEKAASDLANTLGLSALTSHNFQGHEQYTVSTMEGQTKITLTVTDQENGTYYVLMRLEATRKQDVSKLEELQQYYGELLVKAGVSLQWNGAIQGEVLPDPPSSEYKNTEEATITKLESVIRGHWNELTVIDRYHDGNTSNRSYRVDTLPLFVQSGDQILNLQLAIHHNIQTGKQEVAIGSPVLTVEY